MLTENELLSIINSRQEIVDYTVKNFKSLKERADNAEVVKYGTFSTGLGCLYPKIWKVICSDQYGRYLKERPESTPYRIYEFDHNSTPLRIRNIWEEKYQENALTIYFLAYNNKFYGVPFWGDTDNFYTATDIHRFIYTDTKEKLHQYCFFDGGSISLLEFDYKDMPHIHMIHHKLFGIRSFEKNIYYRQASYRYDETARGKIINLINEYLVMNYKEENYGYGR